MQTLGQSPTGISGDQLHLALHIAILIGEFVLGLLIWFTRRKK